MAERRILCGEAAGAEQASTDGTLRLRLTPLDGANLNLQIEELQGRLVADLPEPLRDLLEIAAYVYAADGAIARGGTSDSGLGEYWRRRFTFVVPVRLPDLWSSQAVMSELVATLGFLSDDDFGFEFVERRDLKMADAFFDSWHATSHGFRADEVLLFSGGLDSLAGAAAALARDEKRVALVSHRSASKTVRVQNDLVQALRERTRRSAVLHVPVRCDLRSMRSNESTNRTRSFLFAALGSAVAYSLGLDRCSMYENGPVSHNLPPVGQVIGARATRTTHPRVLRGFSNLVSEILPIRFTFQNPFAWHTKAEVVQLVASVGLEDLIHRTHSCTRVRDATVMHPHCGRCSQCIDRRFGALAAGLAEHDPADGYAHDLFLDPTPRDPLRELALGVVRTAFRVREMEPKQFFAHYGEVSRMLRSFDESSGSSDAVAVRIHDLHQRHASAIARVVEETIGANAGALGRAALPPDCLLRLIVGADGGAPAYAPPAALPVLQPRRPPSLQLAIEPRGAAVHVVGCGRLTGRNAELIAALAGPFRQASREERPPEKYPFTTTRKLLNQLNTDSEETLRRRVLRCRNAVRALAIAAGAPEPGTLDVIESWQNRGYRLNPDNVRLVAWAEVEASNRADGDLRRPQRGRRAPPRSPAPPEPT